jgi:PHD/YefM family antitoxin component YafN of YafNO toxin-antitoxin module
MAKASAPLVDFVRNPDRFVDQVRDATEPLFLTEAGDAAMVLLSVEAYVRLRGRADDSEKG